MQIITWFFSTDMQNFKEYLDASIRQRFIRENSLFMVFPAISLKHSEPTSDKYFGHANENYHFPQYLSALSRTLSQFCGISFFKTAVYLKMSSIKAF